MCIFEIFPTVYLQFLFVFSFYLLPQPQPRWQRNNQNFQRQRNFYESGKVIDGPFKQMKIDKSTFKWSWMVIKCWSKVDQKIAQAMDIHSKSEKVCGTAFSVKKNCGKSLGHFWAMLGHFGSFLGHFGPFWAILGHIWATLGHFGPFLGQVVENLRKVQNFLRDRCGRDSRF